MLDLAPYEDSRVPMSRAIGVSCGVNVIVWDINITFSSKMGFRNQKYVNIVGTEKDF